MNNITQLGLLCTALATALRLMLMEMHSLRINHDKTTTQIGALGCNQGDPVSVHALLALYTTGNTHHNSQPTSVIWEVL